MNLRLYADSEAFADDADADADDANADDIISISYGYTRDIRSIRYHSHPCRHHPHLNFSTRIFICMMTMRRRMMQRSYSMISIS